MPVLYEAAANWWALTIRGVLTILFGILMFLLPGLTITTLALFFGVFAVIQGIFSVAVGLTGGHAGRSRWSWIGGGIVSFIAGVIALAWPGLALLSMLYLLIAWAFVVGVLEIVGSIALRKEIESGEWALFLSGVLAILFALVLLARPVAGILTLAMLIGGFAIVRGILEIVVSLRLRRFAHRVEQVR